MKISMIVACGLNNEIGLDNKLIWEIPEDLAHFKKLTWGHHILMGRKTFNSIPQLENRHCIVLTKSETPPTNEFVKFVDNIKDGLTYAKNQGEQNLFIIGGATIYKQLLPLTDILYLTRIHTTSTADTFFEGFIEDEWNLVKTEILNELRIDGMLFRSKVEFLTYKRKN